MNIFTIIGDGMRRRKIRTILAVLGIAIAAAALYSLLSLKDGYESGMRKEIASMGAQIFAVATSTMHCPMFSEPIAISASLIPLSASKREKWR